MALPQNITFSNLEELNATLTSLEGGGGSVGPTGPQGPQGQTGATGSFNSDIIKIQSGFNQRNTALIINTSEDVSAIYALGLAANGLTFSGITSVSMTITFVFDDFSGLGLQQGPWNTWFRFGTGTPPDGGYPVLSLTASNSMFGADSEYQSDILPTKIVSKLTTEFATTTLQVHCIVGARQNLDPNEVYWFDLFFQLDEAAFVADMQVSQIQINTIAI